MVKNAAAKSSFELVLAVFFMLGSMEHEFTLDGGIGEI
jgi:hypothetical protein